MTTSIKDFKYPFIPNLLPEHPLSGCYSNRQLGPGGEQWEQPPYPQGVCKPSGEPLASIILYKEVIQPAFNRWMAKAALCYSSYFFFIC